MYISFENGVGNEFKNRALPEHTSSYGPTPEWPASMQLTVANLISAGVTHQLDCLLSYALLESLVLLGYLHSPMCMSHRARICQKCPGTRVGSLSKRDN